MDGMVFLIVLGIIVLLIIDAVIAQMFYEAAVEKGFESRKYFWMSFLFCVVGYLLVIALPDRKGCGTAAPQQRSAAAPVQTRPAAAYDDLPEL